jgi:RNA polymerase sigma factor (TIGR02999 family)
VLEAIDFRVVGMSASALEVPRLLAAWRSGERGALEKLMPLVYSELRRMARGYMRGQRRGHTLQTTALVHEAYLRLVHVQRTGDRNRIHFFALASHAMRSVLLDHARRQHRARRGGTLQKVSLDETAAIVPSRNEELIAIDEALNRLSLLDSRKSRIVEMRYFGGLSFEETAEALELAPITVKREWLKAKTWLYRELRQGSA